VIPGNERSVQFVTDKFLHRGAKVINYKMLDIHSSGHANSEDLKEMIKLIKPKYLIPIEGHHSFLHDHAAAARSTGFPSDHIFVARNAQVMEFDQSRQGILTRNSLPNGVLFVKGSSLHQVDEDTLRDRRRLGENGVLIVQIAERSKEAPAIVVQSQGIQKVAALPAFHQSVRSFLAPLLSRSSSVPRGKSGDGRLEERLQGFLERRYGIAPQLYLLGA
jgi:mRNA degradation ribonuclease J1/J2